MVQSVEEYLAKQTTEKLLKLLESYEKEKENYSLAIRWIKYELEQRGITFV